MSPGMSELLYIYQFGPEYAFCPAPICLFSDLKPSETSPRLGASLSLDWNVLGSKH